MPKISRVLATACVPSVLVFGYMAACSTSETSPGYSSSSGGGSSGGSSGGSGGSSGGSSSSSGGYMPPADHWNPPMMDSTAPPLFDGSNPFGEGSAPPMVEVYQTSRSGGQGGAPDHMADEGTIPVTSSPMSGVTSISVDLTQPRQKIVGFGAAITEAVASLVMGLSSSQQMQILNDYWGPSGSQYVLTRTHIGSCDFALAAYTYDDSSSPDPTLSQFSIQHDMQYLVPFLKQAMTTSGGNLKILSSPWTAPAWMKQASGGGPGALIGPNGADGTLLPQYYGAYAQYFSKYLQAYAAQGLKIWAITTQNEANGVGGSREGMQYTPADMNTFIRDNLGPQLKTDGLSDTLVFFFDHNKDPVGSSPPEAVAWAQQILFDQTTNPMVAGTAVHWYDSTYITEPDELDALHAVDPSKSIIYTEGTADGLGDVSYGNSSASFKYSWMKDDYYWTYDGYDWGYWYTSGAQKMRHPVYEPVYRYIRDIIVGLNHWYTGFIDWNAVLNRDGGPGHIVNPVPAAIMVDTSANPANLYYSPIFYAMQQFSKFIRPDATVVPSTVTLASGVSMNDYDGNPTQDGAALIATAAVNTDGSIAVVLFNETASAIPYTVTVGSNSASGSIPGQAMQTLVWK